MSLKDCIDNGVAAMAITKEEGEQLKKRYDSLAKKVFAVGSAREQLIAEIVYVTDFAPDRLAVAYVCLQYCFDYCFFLHDALRFPYIFPPDALTGSNA